jgi:hypothetical protein
MTIICPSSRLIAKKLAVIGNSRTAIRAFSSDCEPAIRLRNAIADYRQRK